MLEWIAVTLGSGRDEILRTVFFRDFESVESSERSDLQSFDSVNGVVDGTGGTGEVEDKINFAGIEGLANVFFYKFESRLAAKVLQIGAAAGEQVIDDDYMPAFAEQGVAEMGSEKTGAAGDQRAF